MLAVVKIGGRQYLVSEGQKLKVDKLSKKEGESFDLESVLLTENGGEVKVGLPLAKGAKVKAKVLEHGRGRKTIVFKYHAKTRYRVKRGFRPEYTKILIEAIKP